MAKLSDLGLSPEAVGETLDYGSMPDQLGSYTPLIQPATYRFRLPKDLSGVWDKFEHTNTNKPGTRIRAVFDDNNPLIIVQSPGGEHDGEPFTTRISNAERKRGKKDDTNAPYISDMDYINRDVWDLPGKPGNGSNIAYLQEFSKHGGTEFSAEVTWNWFCNPNKDIYADNGQGALQQVTGQKGCGTSYYQRDVEKVRANPEDPNSPLVFPERITCQCGANVRAFANLGNFKK